MFQGNYFSISPDAQPFLHYWSLSVEEQFYLFFPLTILLVFRYSKWQVISILFGIGVISLAACIICTRLNPVWAFYLLPTRAWPLLAGCLVGILPLLSMNRSILAPGWLSNFGLCVIGASFILLQEEPSYPGWIAVFPVIGAVAVILPKSRCGAERWLSSRVMVAIGKTSYSLYLWHWPIFCFVDYQFYLAPKVARIATKAICCITLALVTYRYIEVPARAYLNSRRARPFAYASLVATLCVCIPLSLSIRNENYVNADIADVRKGGLVFKIEEGNPSVLLMGDSNGSMYGKLMKDISRELKYILTVISVAAGDMLPPTKLWNDALSIIAKSRPDYIVMANAWLGKLQNDPTRLQLAIEELRPYARHIILLNQPPILPAAASRQSMRNGSRPPFREDPAIHDGKNRINQFLLSLAGPTVLVLNTSKYFENSNGEIIALNKRGQLLFHDPGHLSGYGAARIHDDLLTALTTTGRASLN